MADPAAPDPGYIQRLINGLKAMGTSAYNAISPRATPNAALDPNNPDSAAGKGGMARKNKLDQQIADAGG
jgi:hypothetical protein